MPLTLSTTTVLFTTSTANFYFSKEIMTTFQHNYEFLFLVENLSKNSPFQFF